MPIFDNCPYHNDKLGDDEGRAFRVKGIRHLKTTVDLTPDKLHASNIPQTAENVERSNDIIK
jgi:hypothetical protein